MSIHRSAIASGQARAAMRHTGEGVARGAAVHVREREWREREAAQVLAEFAKGEAAKLPSRGFPDEPRARALPMYGYEDNALCNEVRKFVKMEHKTTGLCPRCNTIRGNYNKAKVKSLIRKHRGPTHKDKYTLTPVHLTVVLQEAGHRICPKEVSVLMGSDKRQWKGETEREQSRRAGRKEEQATEGRESWREQWVLGSAALPQPPCQG